MCVLGVGVVGGWGGELFSQRFDFALFKNTFMDHPIAVALHIFFLGGAPSLDCETRQIASSRLSVCCSVRPHEATRLPPEGVS